MSVLADFDDLANKEKEKNYIFSVSKLICFIEFLHLLGKGEIFEELLSNISKIKELFEIFLLLIKFDRFDCKKAMYLLDKLESSKNKFVTKYQETRYLVARDDQKKFFEDNSDRFDSNLSSVHGTLQSMITNGYTG